MAGLGDYKPIPIPDKPLHDSTTMDRIPVITPSLTMTDGLWPFELCVKLVDCVSTSSMKLPIANLLQ